MVRQEILYDGNWESGVRCLYGLESRHASRLLYDGIAMGHDGMLYSELPDLGPMTNAQLAAYTPPNGESFTALCARIHPALTEHAATAHKAQAPVAIVAHAGVIRAAIAPRSHGSTARLISARQTLRPDETTARSRRGL